MKVATTDFIAVAMYLNIYYYMSFCLMCKLTACKLITFNIITEPSVLHSLETIVFIVVKVSLCVTVVTAIQLVCQTYLFEWKSYIDSYIYTRSQK